MTTFQLRHPLGVELKSVPISAASSGDNTIVAAVEGKRIKVVAYTIQATGTVNAKWKDGANTDLTGALNFQAREGIIGMVPAPAWMFGTSAGNALVLNLSAAISVVGHVTYFDDDAS